MTAAEFNDYAERVFLGPLTAEERMHQDRTPAVEPPCCASCGKPLERGQFKWCSRSCIEEDDGPYEPELMDDELEDEPEPEDEEPADDDDHD